ncbi:L,D-transpeptidase family protein [Candidatus Uhrbacteria bacterium]|nr:L,D-transpeptidase family protein [Candidatus Uhrbacteria bacterium]
MSRLARFAVTVFCGVSVPLVTSAAVRPVPIRAEHAREPIVRIWSPNLASSENVPVFDRSVKNGGQLATGDVIDGPEDDIIVGAAVGSEPKVRVFSRSGKPIREFLAYANGFRGGVRIAAEDTDGDGRDEIITAPGPGIPAIVRIFSAEGALRREALIYTKTFIGGIHVAAADLDGDGTAEVVTAPGPGGGPHVRVLNGHLDGQEDFFPYDARMTDGVTLAAISTNEGPAIATAPESWQLPLVKTWVRGGGRFSLATEFLAFDPASRHGVTLAGFDYDRDGFDELVVARNGGTTPLVRILDRFGSPFREAHLLDPDYRGGLSFASLDDGPGERLVSMPTHPVVTGPVDTDKSIAVNLTEQRLYAFEHGRTARTFLISSGTAKHPTPVSTTTVKKKIPVMDYRWSYGVGHPDNYFLPNVKYNLNILPHIYIHYAYWHNNFGNRMSHGCINTGLSDAEWIYNWADVGTPVVVY